MGLVNVSIIFRNNKHKYRNNWEKHERPYENLKVRKYNETLVFLCYMLRQIRNLGDTFPSDNCLLACLEEIKGNEASFVKSSSHYVSPSLH